MATLSHLPTELLSHIFHLSTKGETAQERQRARFRFGRIARALYLATADATDFYIAGRRQLQKFYETQWPEECAAREDLETTGTTARASNSNIRQLSLVVGSFICGHRESYVDDFAEILLDSPDLVALDLDVSNVTDLPDDLDDTGLNPSLLEIEEAVGGLSHLRTLRHESWNLKYGHLLRILSPLKGLQTLELDFVKCYTPPEEGSPILDNVPHLRTLRTRISGDPDKFVDSLLLHTLGTGLQTLDLKDTQFGMLTIINPTDYAKSLVPSLSHLIHLTWMSHQIDVDVDEQVAVRTLIGAMTSLQSISIMMWALEDRRVVTRGTYPNRHHFDVDPKLLDTLKTLPALHTVELFVESARFDDEGPVISFIESHDALRSLHIHLKTTSGWTREQRDRVEAAGEAAGVVVGYTYTSEALT
ncbi:hypothetical protein RQP46_010766 [Phenoliferia psychrophenolica]